MDSSYSVPVCDAWLVYDPLRGFSTLANREAIRQAQSNTSNSDDPGLAVLAKMLQSPPVSPPQKKRGQLDPDFLGLIPTRGCNLSCRYCDFGASQAREQR